MTASEPLPLSVFFHPFATQCDPAPRYRRGFKPHQIISWHLSTNPVTQFWWRPGHPHLEPKTHGGHKNPTDATPKVPAISDMTHAAPHTHHGDNPVMINTNLPASARGAKVLWCRGNRGKGRGKADTLSAGGATVISGSEIRLASVSVSVTVHMGQSGRRKANSCCSSSCPGRRAFYIMREEVGRSHAYLQEKEEEENNPPPRPLP